MDNNLKEICKSPKGDVAVYLNTESTEPVFLCVHGDKVSVVSITDAEYKNGTEDKLSAKERHLLMSLLGKNYGELIYSYNEVLGMPRSETEFFKMYGDFTVDGVPGAIPIDFPVPNYLNLR